MYLYTYILHYELIIFAFFCIKEEITVFTFPYTREDMWVQTRSKPIQPMCKAAKLKRACILTEVLQYYLYEKVCNLYVRYLLLLFHLLVLI